MKGYIDGINFAELEIQKYYAPPKSWDEKKIKDITTSRIFSGQWYGAQKRDGALYVFVKDEDGECTLRGRSKSVSGEYLDKYEWVPHLHPFFESLPVGTCFIGELYLPRDEQAKVTTAIMNCLKAKAIARQKKEEDKLHYYIFEILAFDGKSYLKTKALDRFNKLEHCFWTYKENYHEWAEYKNGKELWQLLQDTLAEGGEGIVITEQDSLYQPGKRPSKQCLKVKKELQDTIDCVMMGANAPTYEYNGKEIETWPFWFDELTNEKITANEFFERYIKKIYQFYMEGGPVKPVTKNWYYGWAGSWKLGAYKDGRLVHIGNLSGITDEMKKNWKNYVGKVCEITAMEIMDNEQGGKGLRHPKLLRIRDDIEAKDCTWEKIFI